MKINLEALVRLRDAVGGDTEDLAEFIDDFAGITVTTVSELRAALGAQDAKAVRIAAHGFKSNAKDLGAVDLSEVCSALETAAADNDLTTAEASIDVIDRMATEAATALKELDLSKI